ncbi:MAG: PHB depolymerase family esterase [Vicinamibacterales bacterium]
MNRRTFLSLSAAGAIGFTSGLRLRAQQATPPIQPIDQIPVAGDDIPLGKSRLGISDGERDGTVYVPQSYKKGVPMPMLVMLHGFRSTAEAVRYTFPLAEEFGVIVLAPESRDMTWGMEIPGFDTDSRYIGMAVRWVSEVLTIDPSRLAMGGVSDGANYALNMGLAYGDTFRHLMIYSAGTLAPFRKQGKPRIFLAHGTRDTQMPIDRTGRKFAADLKADDYDLTYREYEGGHGAPPEVVRESFYWLTNGKLPA